MKLYILAFLSLITSFSHEITFGQVLSRSIVNVVSEAIPYIGNTEESNFVGFLVGKANSSASDMVFNQVALLLADGYRKNQFYIDPLKSPIHSLFRHRLDSIFKLFSKHPRQNTFNSEYDKAWNELVEEERKYGFSPTAIGQVSRPPIVYITTIFYKVGKDSGSLATQNWLKKSKPDSIKRREIRYFKDSVLHKFGLDSCSVAELCVDPKKWKFKVTFQCVDKAGNKKTLELNSNGDFELGFRTKNGQTYKLKREGKSLKPSITIESPENDEH